MGGLCCCEDRRLAKNNKVMLPILQTQPKPIPIPIPIRFSRSKSLRPPRKKQQPNLKKLRRYSKNASEDLSKTLPNIPNLATDESIINKSQLSQTQDSYYMNTTSERLPNSSFPQYGVNLSTVSESLTGEDPLYYKLPKLDSLNNAQQYKVLEILASYSHLALNSGRNEDLRGVCTVDMHVSAYLTESMLFMITTHAVYVLDYYDFLVNRRHTLQEILLIGISKDSLSCIFHILKKKSNYDIWINSGRIDSIIKCIEISTKELYLTYIPFYSVVNENALEKRFNRLKTAFISKFKIPEVKCVIELLCNTGCITENVMCIKKSNRVTHLYGSQDIVALLTDKSLYALRLDYTILQKIPLVLIRNVYKLEKCEKALILSENEESGIWDLPDSFVENIKKTMMSYERMKLNLEYIHEKQANTMLNMNTLSSNSDIGRSDFNNSSSSAVFKRVGVLATARKYSISPVAPREPPAYRRRR